jgi:hypothetical protein
MIEVVQQNLLNPLGLTALLSLIPLIIFYLVKPKPDKEVMPSMAFFTEEKQKGRIQNALRALKRNKLLLLHMFFIVVAALAIANPLVQGLESEGNSVIVVDTSASVEDDRDQVESFALKHVGERNTIIAAGSEPEILGRNVPAERARQLIRSHDNSGTGTDLVSALQLAFNYPGKLAIASDMEQTENGNLRTVIEDISSEREVKAAEFNHENSHGFVSMKVNSGEVTATVQNFLNRNSTLTVEKPGEDTQVTLEPLSTRQISFSPGPGTHEATLPSDEMPMDNTLYVSLPQDQGIDVKRLGDESRYFRKAVELINQAKYSSGASFEGADIYYISEDYSLSGKMDRIEELREQGSGFIFEPRTDLPDSVPVENRSSEQERNVQVEGELATSFSSPVTGYNTTGNSLSSPEEALVLSEDSRVLLYNVDDQSFDTQITYPVFWKNTLLRIADRKTASELNLRTGQEKDFQTPSVNSGLQYEGLTEIGNTGFYRDGETYSANLLNPEESAPHINRLSQNWDITGEQSRNPAQKYLVSGLALLALLELIYLSRGGAIQ